jgi:hypothetical protein
VRWAVLGSAGAPTGGAVEAASAQRIGWTVGGGVEVPVAPGWTAKAEYLYSRFGNAGVTFPLGAHVASDLATHSGGLSLGGKRWGRPGDTFGLATVINGISSAHAAYLNAGGLGILAGDGQLPHPGPEEIVETYFRLPFGSWQVTANYQFIVNPAYNRDAVPCRYCRSVCTHNSKQASLHDY